MYWFPVMRNKVKKYIESCLKCLVYSPHSGKKEELHSMPKGEIPFVQLHVNHYSPLEKTSRGHKYIFEVIDGFSKFIKLYPCKTTDANEVCKHLSTYFTTYSQPIRVISDRGSCFKSATFKEFLEFRAIHLNLFATSTPKANSQIERRSNRDITPMLAKISSATNKWDTVLHEVEYAINNTLHKSIRNTPSQLLFGVDQRGKLRDELCVYLELLDE